MLRCIPVFLDEDIVHRYYNGYCNNILWPLFHYLGLPQKDRLATTRSFQSQFAAYIKANRMFAEGVNKHYKDGDVVWCHDYHLMFLPNCLKDHNSGMKVSWLLHTPFPSSEIYRTLPSRSDLLHAVLAANLYGDVVWCHDYHLMFLPNCLKDHNSGMKVSWLLHTPFPSSEIYRTLPSRSDLLHAVLAANLVGFHTYDYARHLVSACTRILGLEGAPEGVEDQGKLTRVAWLCLILK
ncbi:hypothetical protein Patl1_12062 [Pistacia atlantica]|uniref:Uncharacterized protein n=1 Tax=Pistacia atlantica TaxID=434234 RepID=A0ACC1A6T2_9ROSI|nr:hypothetical protein Patl1_12062 [Pistacia atlantica]